MDQEANVTGISRRTLIVRGGRGAVGLALGSAAFAQFVAACSGDEAPESVGGDPTSTTTGTTTDDTTEPSVSSAAVNAVLTVGIAADPASLDRSFGLGLRNISMFKQLYASWLRYGVVDNGTGFLEQDSTTLLPYALESFEVEDDGVTYHFNVRQDITFPETGNKMTADDFIANLERDLGLGAPGGFGFFLAGFNSLDQVTKTGDYSFTIVAGAPSPVALNGLADPAIGVQDSLALAANGTAEDPWASEWAARNNTGNGPYVVSEWDEGNRIVLDANPGFWDGTPFFQQVVLQIIPSPEDRILLLLDGTLDIAEDLSIDSLQRLEGQSDVNILEANSILQWYFGLVHNKAPFDNPAARQAVAHAIDYQTLVNDVLHGFGRESQGVWPQASRFHQNAWSVSFDPDRAREILADASLADGFSFSVDVEDVDVDGTAMAVAVQTMLRDVGIEMGIERRSAAVLSERQFGQASQAWIQKQGAFVDDPFYLLFLIYNSGAILNWTAYNNPEIDALQEELKAETDEGERLKLAARAQDILNEDLPLIVLADANFAVPIRSDVTGFVHELSDTISYRFLGRSG